MDIIIGTAGHIDHGKSALVKALTGTDTDRLPEEKRRGITIDLGFAELVAGDVRLGFVDVPGHERFVKNMLAGVGGIDAVLLVIAADEGIMPQTREHFDICRLLNVNAGLIVLTKSDLAEESLADLVSLEAAELVKDSFLDGAPILSVDSISGRGIAELKEHLVALAGTISSSERDIRIPIMPIDRCFSVKGFGTVVTGTLSSGMVCEGDELDVMPGGRGVRVRGLQTHGRNVKRAIAGQRTAINLAGIDHGEIGRGMTLAAKGVLSPTQSIDVRLEVVKSASRPLRSRQRVRVHIGSAEVLGRIKILGPSGEIAPGESGFAQLRLESPIAAVFGERFVIRSYSPQMTIAGGAILDPFAPRHRGKELSNVVEFLEVLRNASGRPAIVRAYVTRSGRSALEVNRLRSITGWAGDALRSAVDECISSGSVFEAERVLLDSRVFRSLNDAVLRELSTFHERDRLSRGLLREQLRDRVFLGVPEAVMRASLTVLESRKSIVIDGESVRSAGPVNDLSPEDEAAITILRSIISDSKLEPPRVNDVLDSVARSSPNGREHIRRALQFLVDSGDVVKVSDEFYFSSEVIADLKNKLTEFAGIVPDRAIDVPGFKNLAAVSRKYAIPLLEYFDREKITVRTGDKRMILK